jgi:hypothetical protein
MKMNMATCIFTKDMLKWNALQKWSTEHPNYSKTKGNNIPTHFNHWTYIRRRYVVKKLIKLKQFHYGKKLELETVPFTIIT